MSGLLHKVDGPRLISLSPQAAMPGGEVELRGAALQASDVDVLPLVAVGDTRVALALSRPGRVVIRIPEGAISGDVVLARGGEASNPLPLKVAVPMAENLHPVANPVVDSDGNVYATVSGGRGQSVPVSIFSIARDFQVRPFVRDLLNATGMAFGPDGKLGDGDVADREIFVYATLEPSIAAYHLAFNDAGVLFVTGPTTSSNQAVYAIDREGQTTVFYQGLGRAQGMAFDVEGNLYVAASLKGQRGIVRITPEREATLAVSGNDLVGLAFMEDGCAVLATRNALFHVVMDVEGRLLV